jgi:DNA-binding transcriptional MerR regulator
MRIGELAQRSGLTASRIRFYETSGLIDAVERNANGYREYTAEAVVTLDIITEAQKAGFSLQEIRSLLPTKLGHLATGQTAGRAQEEGCRYREPA